MKYYFKLRIYDSTDLVDTLLPTSLTLTIRLLSDKEAFNLLKRKYFFIKPRILKAYIRLAAKFFTSLKGSITYKDVDSLFQSGLSNGNITKEYAYYCVLLKEYDLFLKYKRKFERLDKKLFKIKEVI